MHLNMTYQDIRSMPVRYRRWYLKRLTKYFDRRNKMYDEANSPSMARQAPDQSGYDKFSEMLENKFSS